MSEPLEPGAGRSIAEIQEDVLAFHMAFRGPEVPATEMGCILGEEAGEVQRIITKRASGDRPEIWGTLGDELADVVLVCLAIAGREGINLERAVEYKLILNKAKPPLRNDPSPPSVLQYPIPMILHCPDCGAQHVDAPEPEKGWDNPPHKSHLCHKCGLTWRPSDLYTTGVSQIKTRGSRDNFPIQPYPSGR